MRISDWSSDVCSSDLHVVIGGLDDRRTWYADILIDALGTGRPQRGDLKSQRLLFCADARITQPHTVFSRCISSMRAVRISRASVKHSFEYAFATSSLVLKPLDRKSTRLNSSH